MIESYNMLFRSLLCLSVVLLLAGCGSTPEQAPAPLQSEAAPEITLNLPQSNCACDEVKRDYTFLEKGFNALEDGAYLESLQYFQRYQRIENTAFANTESRIAIAYLSILPDSPIFDREAAVDSYAALLRDADDNQELELHGKILIMRDSLETFFSMQHQIDQLKQGNRDLRDELLKREAAIKRLRDLTLGREPEQGGLLGR
jgi:hypothetical protein